MDTVNRLDIRDFTESRDFTEHKFKNKKPLTRIQNLARDRENLSRQN